MLSHDKGQGGREYRDKLQILRQDWKVEARKFCKTDVNMCLIKIAKDGGLQVNAWVLDQKTSRQYVVFYMFLLIRVDDRNDGEDDNNLKGD